MRVLLVEDNLSVARVIRMVLQEGCKAVVDAVDTGEEAVEMARHYDYDAVVLDLTLPDMDGIEVLRQMRAAGRDAPTLVLSGLNGSEIKVRAFKAGADDVLTKPFDNDELCARLKAIVRRSKGISQPSLHVGPLSINLETNEVSVDGQAVHLTGKEYAILELLTMRRNIVLTKEQFLSHLYGGTDEPDVKIIDVFICKLRKKLAQVGVGNLIGTVWGRGYILRTLDVTKERTIVTASSAWANTPTYNNGAYDNRSFEDVFALPA